MYYNHHIYIYIPRESEGRPGGDAALDGAGRLDAGRGGLQNRNDDKIMIILITVMIIVMIIMIIMIMYIYIYTYRERES